MKIIRFKGLSWKLIFIMFDDSTTPQFHSEKRAAKKKFWNLYLNFSSIDSPLIFIFKAEDREISSTQRRTAHYSTFYLHRSILNRFMVFFNLLLSLHTQCCCCWHRCAVESDSWRVRCEGRWKRIETITHNGPRDGGEQQSGGEREKRERITNKLFNFVLTWLEISCSFLFLLNLSSRLIWSRLMFTSPFFVMVIE